MKSGGGLKRFKRLTTTARFVTWINILSTTVFCAFLIVLIVRPFSDNLQMWYEDNMATVAMGVGIAAVNQVVFFVISGFINLLWMSRALKNARDMSSAVRTHSFEFVSSFFIPILSLYRPFYIMQAINRASQAGELELGAPLILWWWICNLGAGVLALALVGLVTLGADGMSATYSLMTVAYMGTLLPMLLASIFFTKVMGHICRLQLATDTEIVEQF
ncbi:DUF4328 domain-containing protein [Asticcacaulis sp. SL142]|uniref:DUF4328 domain-containing protein n=1 Tax=Asticcacaulis sp. SL142 TaxID=2995155 RepID=UPI00226D0EA4|nr:DUF4328 domain-containing protein [Asticcacaulis sp. SL142]WAC48515.1 DUF4328 domain-containing protein [Asticcacaulis sp. SL142]